MALPTVLICDGEFCKDDQDTDDVDGSQLTLHVTKQAEIPARYALNKLFSPAEGTMQSVQHQKQPCQNFRFIHPSWGTHLSNIDTYGGGILALVTMATGHEVKALEAKKLVEYFRSLCVCAPMRFDGNHVLLHFESESKYNEFGEAFLNKRLDNVAGFQVIEIEPATLTGLPICMMEVNTSQVDSLTLDVTKVIRPFSSVFKFIAIRDDGPISSFAASEDNMSRDSDVPNMCLTLLFAGDSQRNARRCLDYLRHPPWRPYSFPEAISDVLDDSVTYAIHKDIKMPMIGVRTGCAQPGVQLTVFVKDPAKFSEMESFYEGLFKRKPYDRSVDTTKIHYCIFACSSHSELMLALYPNVDTTSTRICSLYVQVLDVNCIPDTIKISNDLAYTKDPEGNRVIVFSVVH